VKILRGLWESPNLNEPFNKKAEFVVAALEDVPNTLTKLFVPVTTRGVEGLVVPMPTGPLTINPFVGAAVDAYVPIEAEPFTLLVVVA
jgi:hypothetical protein